MDLLEIWRGINAVLALAALIYLMLDFRVVRYELNKRRLYLTFSLAGMLLAAATGSIVHALQENPLGPQVPLNTAATVWCLIGLWISRDERPSLWKDFPK